MNATLDRIAKPEQVGLPSADRMPLMDRLIKTVIDLQLGTKDISITAQQPVSGQTFTAPGPQYDRRLLLPILPWKMRVHLANNQNFSDNSVAVINFDTVDFDGVGGWELLRLYASGH